MDYITSKIFVMGVGIFVTLAIFTGVILVFSEVNDVFEAVENTDTSIYNQYDNIYSMYSQSTLNTVGLLNTLRKYENDANVHILASFIIGEEPSEDGGKTTMINSIERNDANGYIYTGKIGYETLYDVSVKEENAQFYIIFNRK